MPADVNTTDNKYREGGLSLVYSSLPSFANSYKFNVLVGSIFDGRINIVNSDNDTNKNSLIILGSNNQNAQTQLSIAVAPCDGCYSQISRKGDAILRSITPGSLIVSNDNNGDIKFVTRETTTDQVRMLIDKYGKVGIGTNTPLANLEVAGLPNGTYNFVDWDDIWKKTLQLNIGSLVNAKSTSSEGNRLLTFADYPASNLNSKAVSWFSIEDRNDNKRLGHRSETDGTSSYNINDKTQSSVFSIYEDGTNAFIDLAKPGSYLTVGGKAVWPVEHNFWVKTGSSKFEGDVIAATNIGIGTSTFVDGTDAYRLSVKGKVRAEEVKVYVGWADYVFAKDYELPSLEEVEKDIKEKGYLINMLSGKEIEDNGLFVGEITKIQQEKIEELTLYLIEQKKEIEALKAQMKLLLEKNK